MRKWFRWVLLGIITIGLVILGLTFLTNKKNETKKDQQETFGKLMSLTQMKNAEEALARGITVKDEKDDFLTEFGENQYLMPYFDAKSVSFGVDKDFFYTKCAYWESLPKENFSINGKNGWEINCTYQVFTQEGLITPTKWNKGIYHQLATNYNYLNSNLSNELYLELPEGALEEETDYKNPPHGTDGDFGGLVAGGAGFDYVIGAWPLNRLRIKNGDTVYLTINTEVGIDKVHYAVDMVPAGSEKSIPKIKYVLGENSYEILPDILDKIPRIPANTCPDKEFAGQGDGALFVNGQKYYTDRSDWDWIIENCADYSQYRKE